MKENNIRQDSFKAWLLAARPQTLTGAAVPVMIGLALAWVDRREYVTDVFSWTAAALCMAFAFIMQIDANFINDFFDYARGNDDSATRLGPLRACTQGWVKIGSMKRAIALTTCAACVVGLPLIGYGGIEMIAIGMVCVVFCFLYTTHLSYIGMGDLLVLIFFGVVPVCITYYIQLHTCTWQVFTASLACGAVIDGLLIVNNYRDREQDLVAGKRTIVVLLGGRFAEWLYLLLGFVAVLLPLLPSCCFSMAGNAHFSLSSSILFIPSPAALIPLLYLIPHIRTWLQMKRLNGHALNAVLGKTAANIFLYALLQSLSLLLQS